MRVFKRFFVLLLGLVLRVAATAVLPHHTQAGANHTLYLPLITVPSLGPNLLGTGGTLSGVARRLKQKLPKLQVVGVDPEGSILAGPGPIRSYKVEGIGYDFIPDVLDLKLVDRWIKSNDKDSFRIARQLIRQEGLLVGGSSGSAVWAAMQVARELPAGSRVLTILPDSLRNYLTKFVDDRWMRENGFSERE